MNSFSGGGNAGNALDLVVEKSDPLEKMFPSAYMYFDNEKVALIKLDI